MLQKENNGYRINDLPCYGNTIGEIIALMAGKAVQLKAHWEDHGNVQTADEHTIECNSSKTQRNSKNLCNKRRKTERTNMPIRPSTM